MKKSITIIMTVFGLLAFNCKEDSTSSTIQTPIVEGTVKYFAGGGVTWEIYYPPGYILKNYKWINQSGDTTMYFYLFGKMDSSYLDKKVRVEGEVIQYRGKVDSATVDYSAYQKMIVSKISILY